jgi:hypothetical protein
VTQVVGHPCREVLTQRDHTKLWMSAAAYEVCLGQAQLGQAIQVVGSQPTERAQQFIERLAPGGGEHRLSVKRCESDDFTMAEHVLNARHPVGAFTVNQMPHNVKRAPRTGALHRVGPTIWKILEQPTQNSGRTPKQRQRVVKSKIHCLPPDALAVRALARLTGGASAASEESKPMNESAARAF